MCEASSDDDGVCLQALWVSSRAPCEVIGDCIQNSSHPLNYGAGQSYSISATAAGIRSVESFLTESFRDHIYLNNVAYQGSFGPAGDAIPAMEAHSSSRRN